ncbi:hypothetical protein [Jatrophihabitans fulvus]
MSRIWNGIVTGMLAGAAGATAKNAVSYLDQAVTQDAPPSSPQSSAVGGTAGAVTDAAPGQQSSAVTGNRAAALGNLGGLGIGLGVGAVAGALRGDHATPNPVVAASAVGVAAMAVGNGLAAATGQSSARSGGNLARDLVAHLAYGAVTSWALHRLLDPRTPAVARINPFR